MILSDAGIRRALADGEISIDPLPQPDQFQTSAVDIFLGDSFRVWDLQKLANTKGQLRGSATLPAPRRADPPAPRAAR